MIGHGGEICFLTVNCKYFYDQIACHYVVWICTGRMCFFPRVLVLKYGLSFSDGIGRSGTFCALYSVLERVKTEQVVDVFQAIKAMRIPRPGLVKTTVSENHTFFVAHTSTPCILSFCFFFISFFQNFVHFSAMFLVRFSCTKNRKLPVFLFHE